MDETSPPHPSCFFPKGLCGYLNYLGETVIAPEFHQAEPFQGDLARVSLDGLYGYIDKAGVAALPITYTYLSDPHNGAIMARKNATTFLLTLEGEPLFETKWDVAILLSESSVLVGTRRNLSGRQETRPYHMVARMSVRQILNIETGELAGLPGGSMRIHTTNDGVALVINSDREGPAYIYDATGQIIAGPFVSIGYSSNGLFPAQRGERWGAINAHGEVLIDFQFDSLGSFSDEDPIGWARFSQNDKFGYIDSDGQIQVPAIFDSAFDFDDDIASVVLDGIRIDIGRNGERPDTCKSTPLVDRAGRGNYRLLSSDRIQLNDVAYSYAQISCGNPTLVARNNEFWFLNDDGTRLDDQTYPRATPFSDGVALVYVSATHGTIINTSGAHMFDPVPIRAKIISYQYTTINPGPAHVKLTRELARQLADDPSLLTTPDPNALPDGACRIDGVRVLERYHNGQVLQTYYGTNGQPFLSGTFDYAGCFEGQTAWVGIPSKQQFCPINREGIVDLSSCYCHGPGQLFDASYNYPEGYSCYERGLWVTRGRRNGVNLPMTSHF